MELLDNANHIAQRDTMDTLGLAAKTAEQLRHDFGFLAPEHGEILNIVFAGMGGSALQAEYVRTWPQLWVPFVICKDYHLPDFVGEKTLVIISSYSGNTEETLSALGEARAKGAMIVVNAGGGILQTKAEEHNLPLAITPKAVQPRMVVFYTYRILVEILVAYGLADSGVCRELGEAADYLERCSAPWYKEIPTDQNPAKQLAMALAGKTPIVYSGPLMQPAAYKWKIGFNESAKNTAWYGTYPEFNHNECMGWTSHPIDKPFAVIDLVSRFEHPQTQHRFEVSDRLLSGMRPKALRVDAQGESVLQQLLELTLFGDFVTIYLGLLNGVDPSSTALIEKFKHRLG